MAAVPVQNIVNLHVLVIDRNVFGFNEPDTVEFAGKVEKAPLNIFQTEERLYLVVAEAVAALSEFFAPVAEIPALELVLETVLSGKILNPLHVLLCIRESLVQEVFEKRIHGLWILGHPVFQGSLGGSLESQKVGRIHTEFQNPFYDSRVVIFSAEASGAVGQVHFLSQVPFRREFHEPGIARGL